MFLPMTPRVPVTALAAAAVAAALSLSASESPRPSPLDVDGFARASHVAPLGDAARPRPVVVVLHGNFDRPEWECATWGEAAAFHGFVLCPRGVRTPWATRAEDRWTYGSAARVAREIEAGLEALEARYPGMVTREGMVLAGFSLGAILAPKLVRSSPGKYSHVFLVEGGVDQLDEKGISSLKEAGVVGVGLAMSAPGRRRLAAEAVPALEAAGLRAAYVDMKGAGHGYSLDFGATGAAALRAILGPAAAN
jgi:predicted esterase